MFLAAGWGWFGSNFTPPDSPWWNYLLHTIPFLILLLLSLRFFQKSNGLGLSIFAGVSFIGLLVGIIMGAIIPGDNAYGIKSIGDWVPTIIIMLGSLVWLTTLIPTHKSEEVARTAGKD
ncbi:MAG: hypothetical protein H0V70_25240 [Ktedonobacteraceae bacterium]|nr:hypothetical protein [Ktedonobacteraceae bacterium]